MTRFSSGATRTLRAAAALLAGVLALSACGGDTTPSLGEDTPAPADTPGAVAGDTPSTLVESPDGQEGGDTGSAQLPAGWPETMPLPEDAEIVAGNDVHGDGTYLQVLADTDLSLDDTVQHFQDVIAEHGWTVEQESSVRYATKSWRISGDGFSTSQIQVREHEGRTRMTVDLYSE